MRALLWMTMLLLLSVAGRADAGRLVDVSVLDRDTGAELPLYWHEGAAYVAGTPGHRYAVLLHNRSGRRVLAVLSVDGVNAVSGETAAADQAGYVLAPWDSTRVDGWRKSLSEVAAFEFTALHDSYAARTGRPRNVGVIGVAVFEERRPNRHWHEDEIAAAPYRGREHGQADAKSAAPSAEHSGADAIGQAHSGREAIGPSRADHEALARAGEPLGTGHGAREWSGARRTQFERASRHPAEVLAIRYDSARNLAAAGIIPRHWPRLGRRDPQPFPGGFVPDPR